MQGNHFFNVAFACRYGVLESVIFQNLHYWCENNKNHNKNFFDGSYWTYNSCESFTEIFPYLNRRQILRILKNLEDNNLIKSGCYNKAAYDRTKWYAITEFGIQELKSCCAESIADTNKEAKKHTENSDEPSNYAIVKNLTMECQKNDNGLSENGQWIVKNLTMDCQKNDNGLSNFYQPIPNINTDINTNEKPNIKQKKENDFFEKNENQNESENKSGMSFSHKLFNKWITNCLPCRDVAYWDLYTFPAFIRKTNQLKLSEAECLKAIDNYAEALKFKNPFLKQMTFDRFAEKINDFLAGNFVLDNYKVINSKTLAEETEKKAEEEKQEQELIANISWRECPQCLTKKVKWVTTSQKFECENCQAVFDYAKITGDYTPRVAINKEMINLLCKM